MEYLYFIRQVSTTKYKVGWTTDPISRLSNLQTGNPDKLEIARLFAIKNGRAVEAESHIHNQLKQIHRHIQGEWFDISANWMQIITHELKTRYNKWDVEEVYL